MKCKILELILFKKCKICHQEKQAEKFQKNCNSPDGLGCYCKECGRIKQNARYKNTPEVREKILKQAKKWMKKKLSRTKR